MVVNATSPEHAPYDRALLTAAERLPPAILDQIKPEDGSFCRWARTRHNGLAVVDKAADGQTSTRKLIPVRFIRLETVL